MTAKSTPMISALEVLAPFAGRFAEALTTDLRLVEDLAMDSLDLIELWLDVQKVFGVNLSDESFNRAVNGSVTVGAYVAQVRRVTGRDDA